MTPPSPVSTAMARMRARRDEGLRPMLLGELLIVVILIRVYDDIRALADVRTADALANALDVLAVERTLSMHVELSMNLWLARHPVVEFLAGCWYQSAHLTVTLTLLGWLWWKRPQLYRAARNCLLIINLVGLAVFLWLPVMPPRLLPGFGYIDSVRVAGLGSAPVGPVQAAAFAAMPSLHLAWATWVAFVGLLLARVLWLRVASAAYPFVTSVVVVVTANHYILDLAAGMAVAYVAAVLAGLVPGRGAARERLAQMTRRRSRTPSTNALGTSVPQTVTRR